MTKVITSTSTWSEDPRTPEETVAFYVAQGWVVERTEDRVTVLRHPVLTGTTAAVVTQ